MKCVKCKHIKNEEDFRIKPNGAKNKVCVACNDKAMMIYNSKKKNKLCAFCGKIPPTFGKSFCKNCLKQASKKQKEKRTKAIINGLCITCCKNESTNNHRCEICLKKYKRDLPLATKLFRNARSRATKNNLEFSIIESDIVVPEYCPILGMKLQENILSAKSNSYSIDRIDSNKGYVKGNIHVISHRANQLKSDGTIQELEALLSYLKSLPVRN